MEQLVARARAEEPSYAGLQHRYEDGGFSEEQAKQILEMRLQRLTGIQREELFTELISLTREIARLRDILENESSLLEWSRPSSTRCARSSATSGGPRSPARPPSSPART